MITDLPSTGPGSSTVTEATEVDACPYCGETSNVTAVTGFSPKARGWSCGDCSTGWWVSVVKPSHLFLDRLAVTVELMAARLALREIIALADAAPGITDRELRARLVALGRTVRGSR